MKKNYFFTGLVALSLALLSFIANGQSQNKGWTIGADPFKSNVFVENLGQFDTWINATSSASDIKYVVCNSDLVFFKSREITFKFIKTNSFSDEERIERKKNKLPKPVQKTILVTMKWLDCNTSAVLETETQAEGYYTYGEPGFEQIKAKGYKKLTYKNLYPGIDVEYIVPEKGGIKYSLIVQPGADLSSVKMSYTGDIEKIKIDNNGNIIIKTEAGDITDHAPQSFYKASKTAVSSSFELKENTVSFKLEAKSSKLEAIVVDPWTTTPFSGTTKALDVDYDNFGNVYISGGDFPASKSRIAKYSPAGVLIYSYTCPNGWENPGTYYYYSEPAVLRHSGTVVKGEGGINSLAGIPLKILKLNSAGVMSGPYNTVLAAQQQEIWCMFYNNCTNRLYAFGGGVPSNNNLQIVDTTVASLGVKNVNSNTTYNSNDVVDVVQDDNGDAYILFACLYAVGKHPDKYLMKCPGPNYNPPETWAVPTGYAFNECKNMGYIFELSDPVNTLNSNAFNALAVNKNYLFSYDGKTLKAWDKTNGTNIGSIVVDASYLERRRGGIDVDRCNNVYVAGDNKVHVFSFDGSTFTPLSPITTNITGVVYDLMLDPIRKNLMVCGKNFLTVNNVDIQICNSDTLSFVTSCSVGNVDVCVSMEGIPPFTYKWSTGATTSCVNVSPGTYIVTVTDNSCTQNIKVDTVNVASGGTPPTITVAANPSSICAGNNTTLTASGGATYTWNNSSTNNPLSVYPTTNTTYTVTGTNTGGCTNTATIAVTVNPCFVVVVNSGTICRGNCMTLTATVSGGTAPPTYTWNTTPAQNGSSISVCPTATTVYTVTAKDALGQTATNTGTVAVTPLPAITVNNPSICPGGTATLTASGGETYTW
ncbi:MAG: hypothetical protein WC223_06550, partial [Bacteroidales bacterium]